MSQSPITTDMRQKLRRYFEAGCKPESRWALGLERERVVLQRRGAQPIPFTGDVSVTTLLQQLRQQFHWCNEEEAGATLALKRQQARITLEPAGQVEWSGSPCRSVADIEAELLTWENELKQLPITDELIWLCGGINPLYQPEQMHWIPKERYELMRQILPPRGTLALAMMSLTTSTQVSLDYSSEKDCGEKFRVAAAMVPLITALYANSPIVGGKKSGYISYRSHIWQHTDPSRSGIRPFFFNEPAHFFDTYIDFVIDVPMFFTYRDAAHQKLQDAQGQSYRQFITSNSGDWDEADWLLLLTTIFTEIRLKNYIECRTADGNGHGLAMSYPALMKAVLYHADLRQETWQLFKNFDYAQRLEAQQAAAALGLSSAKMGKYKLLDLAKQLLPMADQALAELDVTLQQQDRRYLQPLQAQVFTAGCSPGEQLLQRWDNEWYGSAQALIEFLSKTRPPSCL